MITLFNGRIALDSIETVSGDTKTGKVVMVAAGITEVKAGDRVIYQKAASRNVRYDDKEYVLVKFSEIDGKL